MNKVCLLGRLTRDPNQRMTTNGETEISGFTLAVDRRFKKEGEQQADFISCTAFGKTAEVINKYCSQGSKIGVTGRIQTGSYTNKEGQTVYTTDVIVESMDFAESKNGGSDSKTDSGSDFMNVPDPVDDEGLPFK